jgi:hypothetical protein
LDREDFGPAIWDPCCGRGTIPARCLARGISAIGSDIVDRGYGAVGLDFFELTQPTSVSIISNPPYKRLQAFVDHALRLTTGKVAVVASLAFLASRGRKPWYESGPLARVYVLSRRPSMPPGEALVKASGGSLDYAWFVFDREHRGAPIISGWLA